jgi:hypothetical protein
MACKVGGVGDVDKTKMDAPEKKCDTEEIRSSSREGDFRRTPDTPERVLSETALAFATSKRRRIRSEGTKPIISEAWASDTMTFSAPLSKYDIRMSRSSGALPSTRI